MIETEVKINLNKKDLARVLEKLGKPEFFIQKNTFYHFPNGFLRIRYENGKTIITYKGENRRSKFNEREEIEFDIHKSGLIEFKDLLNRLGIKETLYYEKKRANFQFNRCTVSIDILSNNKNYVEIEGNKKEIEKSLFMLDLIKYPLENRSYFELLGGENHGS